MGFNLLKDLLPTFLFLYIVSYFCQLFNRVSNSLCKPKNYEQNYSKQEECKNDNKPKKLSILSINLCSQTSRKGRSTIDILQEDHIIPDIIFLHRLFRKRWNFKLYSVSFRLPFIVSKLHDFRNGFISNAFWVCYNFLKRWK